MLVFSTYIVDDIAILKIETEIKGHASRHKSGDAHLGEQMATVLGKSRHDCHKVRTCPQHH